PVPPPHLPSVASHLAPFLPLAMPPVRKGNIDPQLRELAAHKVLGGQSAEAVEQDLLGMVSSRHARRLAKQLRETGSANIDPKTYKPRGRPRKMSFTDSEFLRERSRTSRSSTAAQLNTSLFLNSASNDTVSDRTVYRSLHRSGLSHKKVTTQAREADLEQEMVYLGRLGDGIGDEFVCMDEVGLNDTTSNSIYGWSDVGERAWVEQPFGRGKKYSAIAILTAGGLLGVPVLEGAYGTNEILEMLELYVFPFCNPYPGPLSRILWDNPKIHKSQEVLDAIEDHGMIVLNTPPYMPKYQPDELVFGAAKNWLRRNPWFIRTHPEGPFRAIIDLINIVVPDAATAVRFMKHCGIHFKE
ncbi:hypothetical protein P7C70_g8968, partial [Phenoliferia sp. Uapishka_3]